VLTPRQREVATLLVDTGLAYKEIAARLNMSEGTVRTHTEKIYRAFDVHSRPELTAALRAVENAPAIRAADTEETDVPPKRRRS
jgi:DNA-binding NarL/FixJ family response regulator